MAKKATPGTSSESGDISPSGCSRMRMLLLTGRWPRPSATGWASFRPQATPKALLRPRASRRRAATQEGRRSDGTSRWTLGDNAGLWDLPDDDQGREVVRQLGVLKQHRREQIYPVAGNHDASPGGAISSQGQPDNWWFRKWIDPLGENPKTSGVDAGQRLYPIDGTWDRYSFKIGNLNFLIMSDRNDSPYPVGRQEFGGGSPAGVVTGDT